MDKHCNKQALEEGIGIPRDFRFKDVLEEFYKSVEVIPEMLDASTALRKNGNYIPEQITLN